MNEDINFGKSSYELAEDSLLVQKIVHLSLSQVVDLSIWCMTLFYDYEIHLIGIHNCGYHSSLMKSSLHHYIPLST